MKKLILFISTLAYLFISTLTDAQAPQGIPYQAVVRDASGNLVVNQGVNLQFTVRDNFALQIFYKETHIVYTNELGLLTANIGQGNPVVNTFFDIDWSNGLKFLNVQIDITGGSNFVDMGTTTILSVPYALYAGASKGDIAPGNNIGNTLRWDGATWVNDSALYNDGNSIGIGTNTPDAKLQINGSGENVSAHMTSLITGTGRFHGLFIGLNGNSPYINNQESSDLTFGTSGITRMRIAPDGNVGIDATTPEFKLTLDNDGGILAKGTFGSGADLTTTGTGSRMIWYPKKAAFRVGYVENQDWDDSTIGIYSFATGYSSVASNNVSFAAGYKSTASGSSSTAIGVNATASGDQSMALGTFVSTNGKTGALVVGDASVFNYAILNSEYANSFSARFSGGYNFYSDDVKSINKAMYLLDGKVGIGDSMPEFKLSLEGDGGIIAKGTFGVGADLITTGGGTKMIWYPKKSAFRVGTVPASASTWDDSYIGDYSFAAGYNTLAEGEKSVSLGENTRSTGEGALATGVDTYANNIAATAMGEATFATGASSTTMGKQSVAYGVASTAMGFETTAQGDNSTAMGQLSTANGTASFAEGLSCIAGGDHSVAMGSSANAGGVTSIALGADAVANGSHSVAIGQNVTANGNNTIVLGSNISSGGGNGSFIIGDNSTTNTATPPGSWADNTFLSRFYNGYFLFTSSGINGSAATFVYMAHGDGSWSGTSDKRKKEEFQPLNLEDLLQKVGSFEITSWKYKAQDASHRHLGCMAQDFYNAFHLNGEGNDTTINSLDIDGVNMAAIQALKIRTDELKKATDKIDVLQNEIDEMKNQIAAILKNNAGVVVPKN